MNILARSAKLTLRTLAMIWLSAWSWHLEANAQTSFAISNTPPSELNPSSGGPASASLQQAAEFAWAEFFALNWPAGPQNGQFRQRDTPSSTCLFGDGSDKCSGPLVWETYRGKEEIFPGQGDPPGYTTNSAATSFGYDHLPEYNYFDTAPGAGDVKACPGEQVSSFVPWINLDETDEITLASMYAGVVTEPPSPKNSAPQLIRFLAKANRTEYEYIAAHKLWSDRSLVAKTKKFILDNKKEPPDDGDNYVILPNNSIEVKAGWRLLNPGELATGRFHSESVRYYEKDPTDPKRERLCYRQAVFGLVALHIIQKTKLAPYFIYASFEQADNILNDKGLPVEDVDGAPIAGQQQGCRMDQDQRSPCPTTPTIALFDSQVTSPILLPPEVVTVPSAAKYCTPDAMTRPSNRLYYLNTEELNGLPTGGFICVNQRDNAIPGVIVDANKRAHDLTREFAKSHGIADPVWQYYKLLNVQFRPINKAHAGLFGSAPNESDGAAAENPASYYLANIVVETNRSLQLFSGGLVGAINGVGGTGSNSDYAAQFGFPGGTGSTIQSNMFYHGGGYNMGGCLGCHGGQGQIQGGDFSVIVARGKVSKPEAPADPTPGGASVVSRNRLLQFSLPIAIQK